MSAAQKPEGGSIKHDISVPVAAVPDFIERGQCRRGEADPGLPAGAVRPSRRRQHPLQCQPADRRRPEDFLARWHDVNEVVFAIVMRMGGSISAEHGIGVLKRDELPDVKDKVAIELMRGIKAMLDPQGIMNPGKVL